MLLCLQDTTNHQTIKTYLSQVDPNHFREPVVGDAVQNHLDSFLQIHNQNFIERLNYHKTSGYGMVQALTKEGWAEP